MSDLEHADLSKTPWETSQQHPELLKTSRNFPKHPGNFPKTPGTFQKHLEIPRTSRELPETPEELPKHLGTSENVPELPKHPGNFPKTPGTSQNARGTRAWVVGGWVGPGKFLREWAGLPRGTYDTCQSLIGRHRFQAYSACHVAKYELKQKP